MPVFEQSFDKIFPDIEISGIVSNRPGCVILSKHIFPSPFIGLMFH